MPVLDTQLWVGEPARTEYVPKMCDTEAEATPRTHKQVRLVQFQFYKKPMANRVPNSAPNALPERQKVTGATEEVTMPCLTKPGSCTKLIVVYDIECMDYKDEKR